VSILDRSIARQFLFNALTLLAILFGLIIIIDFSLNFDEYLRVAEAKAQEAQQASTVRVGALTAWIVFDLWWPRLFQLYSYLFGLVLVGALGFTATQMVKNREMVAILAGGMSLWRVARPILVVSLAFCIFSAVNRELILPELAPQLVRDKKDAGTRDLAAMGQALCADGRGNLFFIRSFDPQTGIVQGLYCWERDASGLLSRRIFARSATYRDGGWNLTDATAQVRTPSGGGGAIQPVARLETDLDPTTLKLRRFEGFGNNLSTPQLAELVERYRAQPQPPTLRIEQLSRVRWARVSDFVSVMLTLVICLPFFLRREPANMVVQSLAAAPVALGALVLGVAGPSVPGLPAELSSFIPVMVLAPIAVAAISSVRS